MASLESVKQGLLSIQLVSPFDVSDALILLEEQAAHCADADLIIDFLISTEGFDDCGDPDCEECHYERLLLAYQKKWRNSGTETE